MFWKKTMNPKKKWLLFVLIPFCGGLVWIIPLYLFLKIKARKEERR